MVDLGEKVYTKLMFLGEVMVCVCVETGLYSCERLVVTILI